MSLTDKLIPLLLTRFPECSFKVTGSAQPCAILPAKHPDVGDIVIHDDEYELTVVVGSFTHGHFSNYDNGLTDSGKHDAIIAEFLDFLEDVVSDQVVFWGSHAGGGGWYPRARGGGGSAQTILGADHDRDRKRYVWSGPLE